MALPINKLFTDIIFISALESAYMANVFNEIRKCCRKNNLVCSSSNPTINECFTNVLYLCLVPRKPSLACEVSLVLSVCYLYRWGVNGRY